MSKKNDDKDNISLTPQVFLSTDAIGRLFRYFTFCKRYVKKIENPAKASQRDIDSLLSKEKSHEDDRLVSDGWNLMNKLNMIQEGSDFSLMLFTSRMVKRDFQLLVLEDQRERALTREFVRPPAYGRIQYCQFCDATTVQAAEDHWNNILADLRCYLKLQTAVTIVGSSPDEMVSVAYIQGELNNLLLIDPNELNMYVCALVAFVDFVVTYDIEFSALLSNLREEEDWALTANLVIDILLNGLKGYSRYISKRGARTTSQQKRLALPIAGNAARLGSLFAQHLLNQPAGTASR